MMPWGVCCCTSCVRIGPFQPRKLVPVFFYRDRQLSERLALSVGMFTRGEVGAESDLHRPRYSLGGPALIISVLTLVLEPHPHRRLRRLGQTAGAPKRRPEE